MLVSDNLKDIIQAPPLFGSEQEELDWHRMRHDQMQAQILELHTRNEWLNKQLFGAKSERKKERDHPGQQALFGVEVETQEDEQEDGQDGPNPKKKQARKKKKNGGGRQPLPKDMETVEHIISVSDDEKVNADGTKFVLLRYETSERVHIVAQKVIRVITKREVYGDPATHCAEVTAPVPPSMVPKGKLTDGAIVEILYGKYINGLPFYRQIQDLNMYGEVFNTSLLSDAAKHFAAFMEPIRQAIRSEILSSDYIHIDETTMRELAKGRCKKRYIWAWHAGKNTYYHYGGRGAQEIETVLNGTHNKPGGNDTDQQERKLYHGFFMADGCASYGAACKEHEGRIQLLLCLVHARRQFLDLEGSYRHAKEVRGIFDQLLSLERKARLHRKKQKQWSKEECDAYTLQQRQTHALPIFESLHQRLTQLRQTFVGVPSMTNAINYSLDHWEDLTRYTTRGDLPADNNAAERAMRKVVIGRKNDLFVGSEDAGDWCACNYTIFESARCYGLNPRTYLNTVIERIHQGYTDYASLTPSAIAKETK